jgi:O-antigen biosynthesis alpha-1,3-mannosyltransferase
VTILEGVDRRVFHAGEGDAGVCGNYLLYAGTLAPHKNVPFLVPVLSRLVAEGMDLRLVVTGKHPPAEREALLSQARRHGVAERVQFPGYLSDDELALLMRGCAAFVFPSLNEGFGLAPVEAMACGAPVVAAAAGSLPEVLGDGGLLLDAADTDAWVRAVRRLREDGAFREDVRRRGLRRSREFDWDTAAERFQSVIFEEAASS